MNKKENIFHRIKASVFPPRANSARNNNNSQSGTKSFIFHLHPTQINNGALKFSVTFGLGGMAALLILIQALTGMLLRFVYQPSPELAYDSIITIKHDIFFGELIRNIHHWSGTFLVIIAFLHLLRVYFTGAFHGKRSFNWVLGVVLFILVLFSNFTGYLLPWDQLAFWAITVSTSMLSYFPVIGDILVEMARGGQDVGASTLLIFYNLHTGILPFLIFAVMGFHFWRVRKAGGVLFANKNSELGNKVVDTIPNLVLREFVVALLLTLFLLIFSIFFNAPLLDRANPAFSPNPAKTPWYFEGFQELMLHFHPLFAAIIIPLFLISILFLIPYFKYDKKSSGIWFISDIGKQTGKLSAVVALLIIPLLVLADEYFMDFSTKFASLPSVISNGLIPFSILLILIAGYYQLIKRKFNASKGERIQALFVFVLVSFLVLTFTSLFFRGEGMALIFPWN